MKKRVTAGIDIGTHSVRVVVAEYKPDEEYPTVLGMGQAPSQGMRHGYIINTDETRESIKKAVREAEKTSGHKINRILLSLAGISLESRIVSGTTVISRADNEVTHLDIKKARHAGERTMEDISNRKIIHSIPVHFRLDGKEVLGRATGMTGSKLEVMTLVILALEQHLQDLVGAVSSLGIDIADVVAAPLAASLVSLSKKQKNAGCVLINIGAETVSMIVYENGVPVLLHVFPIGGTDITNDIALGFKIPLEEAENVKIGRDGANTSKRKLDEIIEARLADIFELVDLELKKIRRNKLLPAGAIITGGGSLLPQIGDVARKTLELPSRVETPDITHISKGKIRDSLWSVAYGLTLLDQGNESDEEDGFGEKISRTLKDFLRQFLP